MNKKTKVEADLSPVEGAKIVNRHNATVTTSLVYNGNPAKPGYIWFIYKWNRSTGPLPPTPLGKYRKPITFKNTGGAMVELSFVKQHGVDNVKNMVIVHIVNKINK